MKHALLFGITLCVQGCGKQPPKADTQTPAVAPAPSCVVERRTGPPPELSQFGPGDPQNVLRLMVWRKQSPKGVTVNNADGSSAITYPRYAAKPKPGRPFPGVKYSYVRAFSFLTADERGTHQEWAANGCESQVLAADGTLCPTVAFDGPRLSPEQVETLTRLTATKKTGIWFKCGFDPHHAFVFFDEEDRPVSDVRVCFDCGEWSLRNGPKDAMPDAVYASLARMCRELKLDRCPKGSTAHEQQLLTSAYYEQLRQTAKAKATPAGPLPSEALGIAKETALSALTDVQKSQLCAWRYLEQHDPRMKAQLDSDRSVWTRGYQECVDRFPRCDVPLGEVEDADFRQRWTSDGPRFVAGSACVEHWAFGEHAGCYWGIDRE